MRENNNYTIVTGGSSGLGFELSKFLVAEGKNIIIIGRNKEKLKKAQNKLSEMNGNSVVIDYSLDISDESQVDQFFDDLTAKKIKVNYLYNNAGKGFYGNVENISRKEINQVFNSNLIGLMLMTSRFISLTKNNGTYSRIVNILSTAALVGKKMESVYNSAKWGARGFLESVRDEMKGTNIDVIICCPGGMNTEFWNDIDSGYAFDTFMEPEWVAEKIIKTTTDERLVVTDLVINRRKFK
ncbi:MAG TPA: SDR family oxidoreductase [Clostridia bacterium]|nr:SDR family oxidoreductase [Clostridia bacterium]